MFYAFYLKSKVSVLSPQCKGDYDLYFFIILSGSVATLLLDIDKLMLNQYIKNRKHIYYSVATYIALVISSVEQCIK
jgi:hypothetical protein